MFEIKKEHCITITEKLLWNIWRELKTGGEEPAAREQVQPDLDGLKRNELMALVKLMPDKPPGWSKLSNEQIKQLLKEGA